MTIAYAQNLEDVVLNRAFGKQKTGHYIDIGAWDPVVDSATKLFYDRGWSGINIEPVGRFHRKLTQERPRDLNLRCVIGPRNGVDVPFLDLGDHSNRHSCYLFPDSKTIESLGLQPVRKKVKMMTLDAVIMNYGKQVVFDFVKINAEGAEADIVTSTNWAAFRPKVLVIESVRADTFEPKWHEWESTLLASNYDVALFDGLNRFYCSREHQDLWTSLSVPANVTDGFTLHKDHWLRRSA